VRSQAIGTVIMVSVSIDSDRAAKDDAIKAIKRLNLERGT
jgi:hypothetical protein